MNPERRTGLGPTTQQRDRFAKGAVPLAFYAQSDATRNWTFFTMAILQKSSLTLSEHGIDRGKPWACPRLGHGSVRIRKFFVLRGAISHEESVLEG